ncbi:MBL fold metallo-hydrolase [Salinarchaeum sp. IM2453]|uniref:ComEC/Rec2 family competence protein n=1 Tax=Salinarchaeum sp. IM2453 TaxID=2862870 RepID=UPI001C83E475|nr:ComEC/Rec2 family competence protein [Salinarchaeum sp. IM2453]QZA88075.1 MBL fold metallo-hydrolase [Salinarchaeum sp. IM2453]
MKYHTIIVIVTIIFTGGCAELIDTNDGNSENDEDDPSHITNVSGDVAVHHIDVGQADATLIETRKNETMLIDSGDHWDNGEIVIDYLEQQDITKIDHLVATHAHADHIGGHADIIETFETEYDGIGNAYDPGVEHDTQTYGDYINATEEYLGELLIIEEGDEIPIAGNVSASILNPPEERQSDDFHENSVVMKIEFGEFVYITTGDAEVPIEQRLVEELDVDLSAHTYQAGHHGSNTSSSEPFLEAMSPEVVVISSDFDSQYGHPHDAVLERFAAHNIETYWTGIHNTTVVTTDGINVSVTTEQEGPTDPLQLRDMNPVEDASSNSLGQLTDTILIDQTPLIQV